MHRLLLLLSLLLAGPAFGETALTLTAADGVTVFATLQPTPAARRGTLLLFHQAGANRAEYTPILPELARRGFDAIAIDQRSGGRAFGADNQTRRQRGQEAGFREAIPDLEAALAFARKRTPGEPVLLVGSSYSAALVFLVAARHGSDIAGLMAFSPGEYITGESVAGAAAVVTSPIFVSSSGDPREIADAHRILAAAPAAVKSEHRPTVGGSHGASGLRPDRNPQGAPDVWRAVDDFLDRVAPAPLTGTGVMGGVPFARRHLRMPAQGADGGKFAAGR